MKAKADKCFMRNRIFPEIISLGLLVFLTGCAGYGAPQWVQMKPYTLIKGGDQLWRDQLANRWMAAEKVAPLKGKDSREVLTLLGQPQQIEVIEHQVSEDWYFIYYKQYKTKPITDEGSFLVRFYNEKVIDVVKLN